MAQVVLNGGQNGLHNGATPAAVHNGVHASSFQAQSTPHPVDASAAPAISLGNFHWSAVDDKFRLQAAQLEAARVPEKVFAAAPVAAPTTTTTTPPLGPLVNFKGVFKGTGFNTIFRPTNGNPAPGPPNDNLLELNLTQETLTFSSPLGDVPNRGFGDQSDIHLNGVPYAQAINDVTNTASGLANGTATGIHFEPGLWMNVPASTDPVEQTVLTRMASIPHGTTINAQGIAPTQAFSSGPVINPLNITPFPIGGNQQTGGIKFPSQTLTNQGTSRQPSDLTLFNKAGTITQAILDDPNTVLRNAIQNQKISSTTVFTVSTAPQTTNPINGGGTANINFLAGDNGGDGPNANVPTMSATFWIETVQYQLVVPPPAPGSSGVQILQPQAPNPNAPLPTFEVHMGSTHITSPTTITVSATQIQYSQLVILNFAGLSWPHASVATLVPATNIPIVLVSS